jgi:FkbM family methyltransferase
MADIGLANRPPLWVRFFSRLVRRLPAGRYRLMNWLCRRPSVPFWAQSPGELGGFTFQCDLRDQIAREVCFTGCYEPQETAIVRHLLRPGMVFVDVGTNWGYFSLLGASLVGQSGRVLSLEPDPRLFTRLEENLRRNRFDQVQCLPVAASDTEGELFLAGYSENQGNWGISRIVGNLPAEGTFRVRASALDNILEKGNFSRIDLLKMDIEGAEGLALAGLEKSIRRHCIDRILLELHPAQLDDNGQSVASVLRPLQEAGYSGWVVAHSTCATRKASYSRRVDAKQLLTPFTAKETLDEWPHTLWVRPGLLCL